LKLLVSITLYLETALATLATHGTRLQITR